MYSLLLHRQIAPSLSGYLVTAVSGACVSRTPSSQNQLDLPTRLSLAPISLATIVWQWCWVITSFLDTGCRRCLDMPARVKPAPPFLLTMCGIPAATVSLHLIKMEGRLAL